jgi:hypothetical protein
VGRTAAGTGAGGAQRDPGAKLTKSLGHQRSVRGSIASVDLDQVPAELLEGLLVERYGTDFDVRMIASVGLARAAWRNTEVEDAHAGNGLRRIDDGEMFAANVATTRLIHRYLDASSGIDWAGLANELVRSDRVAGARTVSDLLGELYDGWAEQSHALIETQGDFELDRGRAGSSCGTASGRSERTGGVCRPGPPRSQPSSNRPPQNRRSRKRG